MDLDHIHTHPPDAPLHCWLTIRCTHYRPIHHERYSVLKPPLLMSPSKECSSPWSPSPYVKPLCDGNRNPAGQSSARARTRALNVRAVYMWVAGEQCSELLAGLGLGQLETTQPRLALDMYTYTAILQNITKNF